MGRPKGSKNKGPAAPRKAKANGGNGAGPRVETTHHQNSTPLTDEQSHVLVDQAARTYAKALDEKKAADARFKNVCKTIRSDGVKLQDVKDYLEAESEEGQARMRERVERMARIARWRGFPIGTQAELFPDGMTPSRSFTAGKEAGLGGLKAEPPATANVDEWMRGWHAGQAILGERFKDDEDVDDVRPPFLQKDSTAQI